MSGRSHATISAPSSSFSSVLVYTATTPGWLLARDASMPLILAWPWGLRTIAACSMPNSLMSST